MTARSKPVAVIGLSPLSQVPCVSDLIIKTQSPVMGHPGRDGGFGRDRFIAGAAIEAGGGRVPARDDDAQGARARLIGVPLGYFEERRADTQSAKLGEGREHVDIPGAGRPRLELDQGLDDRRDLGKAAEVVGIVEPVADEARRDLAVHLGDHGVLPGEAADVVTGALAPKLEHGLAG
jgi:hypothetical protein